MNKIFTSFLKGLLILVPLVVTGYTVYFVFIKIDGLLNFRIPGLGILVTVIFIVLVGFLGSNIFIARFLASLEKGMTRLPVVKLLYFALKDLINAFVGEKKSFSRPVMFTLGLPIDIRLLGFVTADALDFPDSQAHVAVYVPQSYNFGGVILLVPRDRIISLPAADSTKIMAFIMSGGVAKGAVPSP